MTGNRTTELRISEPLRGFIRHQSNRAYIDGGQANWLTEIADKIDAKHEQAIAATLGSGTCELKHASWDDGQCTWGCICSACDARFEHETGIGYNYCPNCGAKVIQGVDNAD